MAFKTVNIKPLIFPVAARVGILNSFMGIAGTAACAAVSVGFAAGFALGFLTGVFNQYLCLRIVRKAIHLEPARAKTFVTTRYFTRFAMTLTVMLVLVGWAAINPWALLAGFGTTFLVTIAVMVAFARGGSSPSSLKPSFIGEGN
jgi:hypothetical protein